MLQSLRFRPWVATGALAAGLTLVVQSPASADTAHVSFNQCIYSQNGAGPKSQVGGTVHSYYLAQDVVLRCGSYTGPGLRHTRQSHPEIEDAQGAFFRCLDHVLKHSITSRPGTQSGYRVLFQRVDNFGSYVEVVVDTNPITATVVTAYTGNRMAVAPTVVRPNSFATNVWENCGSL